jgi:hypothetical protein
VRCVFKADRSSLSLDEASERYDNKSKQSAVICAVRILVMTCFTMHNIALQLILYKGWTTSDMTIFCPRRRQVHLSAAQVQIGSGTTQPPTLWMLSRFPSK